MSEQIIPVADNTETVDLTEFLSLAEGGFVATFESTRYEADLTNSWGRAELLHLSADLEPVGEIQTLMDFAWWETDLIGVSAAAVPSGGAALVVTRQGDNWDPTYYASHFALWPSEGVSFPDWSNWSTAQSGYDIVRGYGSVSVLQSGEIAVGGLGYGWDGIGIPYEANPDDMATLFAIYSADGAERLADFVVQEPDPPEGIWRRVSISGSTLLSDPSGGYVAVDGVAFIDTSPMQSMIVLHRLDDDGVEIADPVIHDGYSSLRDTALHPDGTIVLLATNEGGTTVLLKLASDGTILAETAVELGAGGSVTEADLSLSDTGLLLLAGIVGDGVYFREYGPDLVPITDSQHLNETTTDVSNPEIAAIGAGTAAAAWISAPDETALATLTLELDPGPEILGTAGDDILFGTAADEILRGWMGDDTLQGGPGADLLDGGLGFDIASWAHSAARLFVDLAAPENNGGGARGDLLAAIEGLEGGRAADHLRGDDGGNVLLGGNASDRLYGRIGDDSLNGEQGADALYGNQGADVLTGGEGDLCDRFIYFSAADSRPGVGNRDVITDFNPGLDRIEISRIDADITQGFRQDFTFIADAGFSGAAGELRFEIVDDMTLVQADRDGDLLADFEIELLGAMTLTADNFLL